MFTGFFDPLILVASWFVGIFGGLFFGLMCLAVIGLMLGGIVIGIAWLVVTLLEYWTMASTRWRVARNSKRIRRDV